MNSHSEEIDQLTASGERLDPGRVPRTHDEHAHLARYHWAAGHARGDVLDVACGTGYGSAILVGAPGVAAVTGVDSVRAVTEHAAANAPSAAFVCAEVPPLPFAADTFDTVVTMETIEHLEDDVTFMREIRRVLRPEGAVLLSTPNAAATSPDGVVANPWHVREYELDALLTVLRSGGFGSLEVFGQQVLRRGYVHDFARRVMARFPSTCRPESWWDRIGHGSRTIEPWTGQGTPTFWVIRA